MGGFGVFVVWGVWFRFCVLHAGMIGKVGG